MEAHAAQQFDFLLHTAVERYSERLMQHHQGAAPALRHLRAGSTLPSVKLETFVDALFSEFLLDNPAGACFILQALADHPAPSIGIPPRLSDHLILLAKAAFGRLLRQKTEELLEQSTLFEENP